MPSIMLTIQKIKNNTEANKNWNKTKLFQIVKTEQKQWLVLKKI